MIDSDVGSKNSLEGGQNVRNPSHPPHRSILAQQSQHFKNVGTDRHAQAENTERMDEHRWLNSLLFSPASEGVFDIVGRKKGQVFKIGSQPGEKNIQVLNTKVFYDPLFVDRKVVR